MSNVVSFDEFGGSINIPLSSGGKDDQASACGEDSTFRIKEQLLEVGEKFEHRDVKVLIQWNGRSLQLGKSVFYLGGFGVWLELSVGTFDCDVKTWRPDPVAEGRYQLVFFHFKCLAEVINFYI
jgi:hypothetical protein